MMYLAQATELSQMLQQDQAEWRNSARATFKTIDKSALQDGPTTLRQKVHQRAERMLNILNEIGEPSLSNIGADAAQAMSILALHDSLTTLSKVLDAFTMCYERQREDTYYQAIPSMTDWKLILEKQPQKFGTIWLFDENNEPFLPTVENFDHVNERRTLYDIGPLRWPKSLAIPELSQPWLNRPLAELVMRNPTEKEYADFANGYLG